jgi:hypothetical protein
MKFVTTFLFLALSLFSPAVKVQANDVVQILFNDQYASSCNDDEWWQIDNQIYVVSQIQRKLRGDKEAIPQEEEVPVDETNRALWPTYCANNCAGFAPKTCKALTCVGYRRRTLATVMRGLFYGSNCQNQITELNVLLTNLGNRESISSGCKEYLGLSRQYNCFTNATC